VDKAGAPCFSYRFLFPDERVLDGALTVGELFLVPLATDQEAQLECTPAKGFDFGAGNGKKVSKRIKGGVVGVVLDARGRPISIAQDENLRVKQLQHWANALQLYPEPALITQH
jgi:hypothetical protein